HPHTKQPQQHQARNEQPPVIHRSRMVNAPNKLSRVHIGHSFLPRSNRSNSPSIVSPKHRTDLREQRQLRNHEVRPTTRPVTNKPKPVTLLKPNSDLLDRCTLQIGRQPRLTRPWRRPRHHVAPSVCDPAELRLNRGDLWQVRQRRGQRNDAGLPKQKADTTLQHPSLGLSPLEFELGDRFNRVTARNNLSIAGRKFLSDPNRPRQRAVALMIEPRTDRLDPPRQQVI